MNKFGVGERAPWGDFPPVIVNSLWMTFRNEPEYQAAKSGNEKAALELIDRLLTDSTMQRVTKQIGDSKPLILPVLAVEKAGNNKIPLTMARVLAKRLTLDVEENVLQRERVGRTGTGADHRLAFNPSFEGEIKTGQTYLILDDNITMGGTLASLRGYIENRGGKVLAAMSMTGRKLMVQLAVTPKMLAAIEHKHGHVLDQFWQEQFNYGIKDITQAEGGYLRHSPSFDKIRNGITQARYAAVKRMAKRGTGSPLSFEKGESAKRTEVSSALEQNYRETLNSYTLAKYEQADRIESCLEGIIDRQQARLQQTLSNRPGFLSMPGTRKAWQTSQAQQQGRLETFRARLETVREVKEGIGLRSPRVEELATKKMRAENPELAADWDAMREAARHHQAMVKKQEQERKQSQERSRGKTLGLSRPPQ